MEVIYLLVPLSILFVVVIVVAFSWAMKHGQFSDLERRGRDILLDDDDAPPQSLNDDDEPPAAGRS